MYQDAVIKIKNNNKHKFTILVICFNQKKNSREGECGNQNGGEFT